MTAPTRIAAFLAMLAVVFAASLWVGGTFGPTPGPAQVHPVTDDRHQDGNHP
ncbi:MULTISPECIES: hypothetical protein [Mycolicibacterium]|uniref:Uncharacterized protein n=1 Tax=Mycolicibacterium gilvum (strain DSM 45189 / LMG 24558 / Spyr1) TaxID=278137 RepID=E6TNX0_MYCSR|nr:MULTISPECIES: hypothetical protein [Mycolicibacterium]ADT98343.1 hypothetical protein Mspyr1_16770 [Mycolicibacterium gilvum Spyr1]MBV5245665.1 hypothetical protein [Mycolicibacterium sp. PAM1]